MTHEAHTLVGRGRELEQLRGGIEDALAGSGSVWFVCGEPGIGKSRLAEEVARAAQQSGVTTAWGRSWEAGGAPPYWPFIQVLRSLARTDAGGAAFGRLSRARVAQLGQLLPEISDHVGELPALPELPPEEARFQLLDAMCSALTEIAAQTPLLIVLEDLHASDRASVQLLDFVAGEARGHAMTLVGTYRDAEAARSAVGPLLSRLSGIARTLALRRMTRHEVAAFLEQDNGHPPLDELVDAVHATTEGNPLFVVETARLLATRGSAASQVAIPPSIKHTLGERLRALPAPVRELLELCAVVGREFERATLAQSLGRDPAELAVPLAEAVDAAVLLEQSPGSYRFSHILVREVLHQELSPARRSELHLLLAGTLERTRASWTEIAHHYLAAGESGRERALDAAEHAADNALAQFAFEQAAELYATALDVERRGAEIDACRECDLLLKLARAQLLGGEVERGKRTCAGAAALARKLGDPERLAQAALEHGQVFVFASVDDELVALLREALDVLPPEDSATRARLLGRLAAATQPSLDPKEPIQIARDAIAMARRLDDERTLLETLRAACSAMMDLADPVERSPLNREHLALARRMGDRVEELRGYSRHLFDCYELGDIRGAHDALDQCVVLAGELDHPVFQWRAEALCAMRSAWQGEFDQADAHAERARQLSERTGDPNAPRSLLLQRLSRAVLRGRFEQLPELLPMLERVYPAAPTTRAMVRALSGGVLARAGQSELALASLDNKSIDAGIALGDRTMLQCATELCWLSRDRGLAGRLIDSFAPSADHYVHGGMVCLTWDTPVVASLGVLYAVREAWDAAVAAFERAVARTRMVGSQPLLAWILFDYATHIPVEREPGRFAQMLDEAEAITVRLGMDGLRERIVRARAAGDSAARSAAQAAPAPTSGAPGVPELDGLRLWQEGESFWIEGASQRFLLKDTKGVRILAQLIAEPGREFHVLDLSSPGGAVDTGDAGEVIDAEARAQYRTRVEDLRAAIEEATENNDFGRAERAREELSFLTEELGRAVGLGARERRSGSATERARVNVQRRLKDAIGRIESQSPEIARHLSWAVKTGTFCSYDPR